MYKIIPSAYIFTHIYLNTMQQGIQPLHVVGEIFAKYGPDTQGYTDAIDWATNHKVVRLLNGGGSPHFENHRINAYELEQAREVLRYQTTPQGGIDLGPNWRPADPQDNFPLVQFLMQFRSAK